MTHYTYIWEFMVKAGKEAEFVEHYSPDGTWAKLFKQAPGYVETLLLKDRKDGQRYFTVDRWRSEAAYQAFRSRFADSYAALDRVCEDLTTSEKPMGCFDE
ncbi:antibiotic biosynthesis monooxygenase family protein [Dyella choica]|uniref:Antibiotic biosynthesis monooxygenase n=1 Tax=Dyella choica TaxID=1927959 RepID=A0A3S0S384_9GAMM|nr:antibiotic biosynthesis monooxygenase family protein [Dyella choica]RUL79962.1 antibiotic biosynthesis monooxygenase [Dyella choica]